MHSLAHDYPATLMAEREAQCLSLYQPTDRQHTDNAQDPVRFRNLVKRLAESLRAKNSVRDISALLRPFEALAEVVPSDRMPTRSGAAALYRVS